MLAMQMAVFATRAGGLVGAAEFSVLPNVGSLATAALTLAAMLPCLVAVWRQPAPAAFPSAVFYCTFCSFMLGCAAEHNTGGCALERSSGSQRPRHWMV